MISDLQRSSTREGLSAISCNQDDSTISSIELLPDDILALVLEVGTIKYRDAQYTFRSSAIRVSRRWRDCILNTPALWSILDIWMGHPVQKTLQSLSHSLERSKEKPLDIVIDFSVACRDYEREVVMMQLGSHSPRWKRLNIIVGVVPPDINDFTRFPAPKLMDLAISTSKWMSDPSCRTFFEQNVMPNVSKFTIKGANLSNSSLLCFQHLTVLKIYGGILGNAFLQSLSISQSLVHLEFHLFFPNLYSVFDMETYHLPTIQNLPTLRSFHILTRGFTPMNLNIQHWGNQHLQDRTEEYRAFGRPGSPVVTFELYEISPYSFVDDIPFERAFTHLTHLILHQVATDGLLSRLIVPHGKPVPCPLLRCLFISCDINATGSILSQVVQTRKAAGHPIPTLHLDEHFLSQPELTPREWLEKNLNLLVNTGICNKHKRTVR